MWIKKSLLQEQYKTGRQLGICRFLLLASMHDVISHNEKQWITEKGKPGTNITLSYENWIEFLEAGNKQYTIEHIAPQNPKLYDWDSSLDDGELTNTIGNLVILARGDNSEASNKSWPEKQKLYKELNSKHYSSSKRNYNSFMVSVANAPAWRRDIILERGENLLSNAWDNLIPWIID